MGGSEPGLGFDVFNVSSTASLFGRNLNVTLANGFVPEPCQQFPFLTYGTLAADNLTEVGIGTDVGGGLFLRYAWPNFFLSLGGRVSGSVELEDPSTPVRLDVAPDFEAGVRLGVVTLSTGYRLVIPVASSTPDAQIRHVVRAGVGIEF